MPKTMPKSPQKQPQGGVALTNGTNGTSGTNDKGESFNTFFQFFRSTEFQDAFQDIQKLHHENEALKQKVNDYEGSFRCNAENLTTQVKNVKDRDHQLNAMKENNELQIKDIKEKNAFLQGQLNDLTEKYNELDKMEKKEAEELTSLHADSVAKDVIINGLEADKQREAHDAERAWGEHDRVQRELDQKLLIVQEFDRLKGFQVELVGYEGSSDQVNSHLDDLFKAAFQFSEKFLYPDLPADAFSHENWDNISQLSCIEESKIPLCASNSKVAKDMRVALGLYVIARALMKHLFQPIYLSGQEDGSVSKFLVDLGAVSRSQEAHVRSVLLEALHDHQDLHGTARAGAAANEIFNIVKDLVPAAQLSTCEKEINNVCNTAHETWSSLQFLQEQVSPVLKYRVNEGWRSLQSKSQPPPQAQAQSPSPKPENTGKGAGNKGKGKAAEPPKVAVSDSELPSAPGTDEQVTEVWPKITAVRQAADDEATADDYILSSGYYIPEWLLRSARSEQRTEEQKRKNKRAAQRAVDSAQNKHNKGRRSSFLGNGNAGGTGDTG